MAKIPPGELQGRRVMIKWADEIERDQGPRLAEQVQFGVQVSQSK
jgi:hypothetical protein